MPKPEDQAVAYNINIYFLTIDVLLIRRAVQKQTQK